MMYRGPPPMRDTRSEGPKLRELAVETSAGVACTTF
jgi:hypothetical protein